MLRVAIVADYAEEDWPSMDLVADMLTDRLRGEHAGAIDAALIRPPMPRRLTHLPFVAGKLAVLDRAAARQWDYPRQLEAARRGFDVYHIVDHTYAHLVHGLPAARTIVTCHDVDAFRSILQPDEERRSLPFRWMADRILNGLRKAAHVPCDSEATRDALVELAAFPADRLSVIANGADPGGSPIADPATDFEAGRILGPRQGVELLHVGSTIDRKRIDVLLEVFAALRRVRPDVRLIRVGGPFTGAQRAQARDLGVADAIAIVPFVDRGTLSAIYRRAALTLLPSEREGFGLPLVESLACGTPMVASDIPVFRELGRNAVTYAALGDVAAWRDAVIALLAERHDDPERWRARCQRGITRAADFSWSQYATAVASLYAVVATRATAAGSRAGEPERPRSSV
jgi:glycosyltransferase involved in cell wall biosynthesis